ncbi:P-loop NTPase domain-containing protein [Actinidia chinensis var. chinensis]|uniref:P-loop NTPase domain-containing protein n=1 Tax=Actinidia chinensis var. chinensis TaxID=1590841 RepID=A0A2R6P7J2_ACTCC|nr:P-loop NTPase domain-containing protein [Actinidia chinensis var. chinensis]
MMRSFVDEKQNPLVWASTYHAGEYLDPEAVAAAKGNKRKAKKLAGVSHLLPKDSASDGSTVGKSDFGQPEVVALVDEEYRNQCAANSLSSKGIFQLVQRHGSSRHLMALLNTDGSLAKAWPVNSIDCFGKPIVGLSTENGIGTPMYGAFADWYLQFGPFGISALANDTGCTSHASSVDESRGDITGNGSRYYSSSCSSPRMSDGPAKELKEEHSVQGSDEEVDEPPEMDSDEDLSDDSRKQIHEEMEGSVDGESTKSDEEYDDLAIQDIQENGYWSNDNEEFKDKVVIISRGELTYEVPGILRCKDMQKIDYVRTKCEPLSEPPCSYSPLPREKSEKRLPSFGNVKMRRRSLSTPGFGKHI